MGVVVCSIYGLGPKLLAVGLVGISPGFLFVFQDVGFAAYLGSQVSRNKRVVPQAICRVRTLIFKKCFLWELLFDFLFVWLSL